MPIEIVKVRKFRCGKCNYGWFPKDLKDLDAPLPKVCPSCKSRKWNEEPEKPGPEKR